MNAPINLPAIIAARGSAAKIPPRTRKATNTDEG
jgi:hypothetical protein